MKTIIRGLLTTVLVFTFTMVPTVIFAEKSVNEKLIGEYTKEEVSKQMTTTLQQELPELTTKEIEIIQTKIDNSKTINDIINKYTNRILKDLSSDKVENINIKNDIATILEENKSIVEETLDKKIADEDYDRVIDEIVNNYALDDAYKHLIEDTKNNMPKETKTMIEGYNTITSDQFIITTIIISIVSIILIALLKKPYYKWIVNVGIAGIISSLFICLIGASIVLLLNIVIDTLDQPISISATPMFVTAAIMLIISVVLIIINNTLDKKLEQKQVKA